MPQHKGKEQYSFVAAAAPPCGNEWWVFFLPLFSFLLKERTAVKFYYCQGFIFIYFIFLRQGFFGMCWLLFTSSHDGSLQGVVLWWLLTTSNTHTHMQIKCIQCIIVCVCVCVQLQYLHTWSPSVPHTLYSIIFFHFL